MRAGRPAARANATKSAVCSLQSPTRVRRTSRADGRLTVGFFSRRAFTCRVRRSACWRGLSPPAVAREGLGANLRCVALDERLRLQERAQVGRARLRLQGSRVHDLDDVAIDALAGALQVGAREVRALEPQAQPFHVARLLDALLGLRHDGGRLQHVDLDAARHRLGHGALLSLGHREQPHRALLAHDLAGVRHPRCRLESAEGQLDAERRQRPIADADQLTASDLHADRGIPHRRRIEHGPFVLGSLPEPDTREVASQAQHQRRSLGQRADLRARAAGARDRQRQPQPIQRARSRGQARCLGPARSRRT